MVHRCPFLCPFTILFVKFFPSIHAKGSQSEMISLSSPSSLSSSPVKHHLLLFRQLFTFRSSHPPFCMSPWKSVWNRLISEKQRNKRRIWMSFESSFSLSSLLYSNIHFWPPPSECEAKGSMFAIWFLVEGSKRWNRFSARWAKCEGKSWGLGTKQGDLRIEVWMGTKLFCLQLPAVFFPCWGHKTRWSLNQWNDLLIHASWNFVSISRCLSYLYLKFGRQLKFVEWGWNIQMDRKQRKPFYLFKDSTKSFFEFVIGIKTSYLSWFPFHEGKLSVIRGIWTLLLKTRKKGNSIHSFILVMFNCLNLIQSDISYCMAGRVPLSMREHQQASVPIAYTSCHS